MTQIALDMLSDDARAAYQRGSLSDVVFADDTLLMGVDHEHLNGYLAAVEEAGKRYGMELHWGKTQAHSICTNERIIRPDGIVIKESGSMEYLGALLSADGRTDSEVSRRMGVATSDFRQLQKLWNHANVSLKDKMQYFDALIVSRLQYGLATIWMSRLESADWMVFMPDAFGKS